MKAFRLPLLALGMVIACVALSWVYTSAQLSIARSKGVYETAEQGMRALVDKGYASDRQVKILCVPPNNACS